jgi:hypothetical protein
MPIDILEIPWKFPNSTVYVLGTGLEGVPHYGRIPWNAWVIGTNKAICLQGGMDKRHPSDIKERMAEAKAADPTEASIPMAIWLCADTTLYMQEWFQREVDVTIRCGFTLSNRINPTVVFSDHGLMERYPSVPFFFRHGRTLRKDPKFRPLPGVLRCGASIASQAVQLAFWKGARRIVLCGVDMRGLEYFDGTVNKQNNLKPDGTSKHLRMFNGLCAWLKGKGVEVVSLSPTALNIPQV